MELVYLWVEDYKNIQKQGFNFSPRFMCEYDEVTKELTIVDKEETGESYSKNFFGDNINVTAIVGENGSGKSGIIEELCKQDKVFYSKDDKKQTININPKNFYKKYDLEILNLSLNKTNVKYFEYKFLPNAIAFNFDKELSINKLVDFEEELITRKKGYRETNILDNDSIKAFEKYLQDAKAISIKQMKEEQDFTLFLSLNYFAYVIQNKKEYDSYYSSDEEEYSNFDVNPEDFEDEVYTECRNYIDKNTEEEYDLNELGKFIAFVFEIIERNENVVNFEKELIELVEQNLELKEIIKIIEELKVDIDYIDNYLTIKITENKHEKIKFLLSEINFIEIDFALIKENQLILFNSLSTGEQDLLKIYAILYKKVKKELLNIICLDEINVFWHPNWQKNFIKEIVDFLMTFFQDTKINLILATHSPFILSDLPKENIIFLEKGKQVYPFDDGKQTFGANIHTLLSHGFFMKDGLMGEFAKSKIDDVIKYLNNDKKSTITTDKDAQNIIDIIGEPIIKRELQRMLKNKMELSNKTEIDTIKDKIKLLTERLEKLEPKDENEYK